MSNVFSDRILDVSMSFIREILKVAFVPRHPFYIGKSETNTLRLNFSSVDQATIEIGIRRLGDALKTMLN